MGEEDSRSPFEAAYVAGLFDGEGFGVIMDVTESEVILSTGAIPRSRFHDWYELD
jgi:hypothetical protein